MTHLPQFVRLFVLLAIASPTLVALGAGLNMDSAQSIVYASTSQPLSGTINNSQQAHYYRLAVKAGTFLSAILSPTSQDLDLDLIEDTNSNGAVDSGEVIKSSIFSGTSADSFSVQAPLNRSALYYLRVRQGFPGANSSYNLAVSFTDADGPQPDLVSVTLPSSVIEGEEFTVSISAENDGGPGTLGGPDSAINASIKYSDNNHNLSVSGPTADWAGVYKINYSPGQGPIYNFNGDNIGNAVDHLVEASDRSWQGGVRRAMSFKVTPNRPGTLLVRARVTMRSGVRGNFLTDTTASGGSSSTDQQSWSVREFSVTVAPKPPPTGTITLTVRNGPDASFPVAVNAVVVRRSTSGQYQDSQTTDGNGRATFTVAADTAWDFEAFYVNPSFGNGGNTPPFQAGQAQPEFWGSIGGLTVSSAANRAADLYRWAPIVRPSEVSGFDAVLVQRTDTGAILAPGETVVAGTPLKFQVMVTNRHSLTLDCQARLLLDQSRSGTFDQDFNSVLTPLGPGGLGGFVFTWTPQVADAGDYYSAPWAKVRLLNGNVWTSDSWSWSAAPLIKVIASQQAKGITVITHGYQFSTLPQWTLFMARAISNRVGTASVGRYDKATGSFLDDGTTTAIQPSIGESVLVFDWADESDVPAPGWSEAAGDALLAALVKFVGGASRLGEYHWHFIGHSRGCVVNSEAVERLAALSVQVGQVTTLDPHDFAEVRIPSDGSFKDWLLGMPQGADDRSSWGVTTWNNVDYADNYYSLESQLSPNGRPLGSKSWQLNVGDYPPNVTHSDVHAWYYGTVNLMATREEDKAGIEIDPQWYPAGERTQRGWNLSRRGARFSSRPVMDGNAKYAPVWKPLENGVFNGNFDHVDNSTPGWSLHGGSAIQASVAVGGNNYVVLNGQNATVTHNRLLIPPTAGRLIFKARASGAGGTLRVSAANTILGDVAINANGSVFEDQEVPIPANLRGNSSGLTFFVASGGASATMHLDDIAFGPETPAPAIITDRGAVNVPEGGTATVQVKLSAQPPGNVTVSVNRASGDNDITVQSGSTLTFTPSTWNVYQSVTIVAGEDVDTVNGVAVIRFSGPGVVSADVTAVEVDNDALNILSSVSALSVPEGATASFMVRLNAQPPGNVTVSVARVAGDTDLSVLSGGSLTFTTGNWNVNQTVTLVAAEDVDTSNGSATFRLSAIGLPSVEVIASELDNDSLPAGSLQFSQANYTVSESAGSLSITVVRNGGSSGAVSVSYGTVAGTATSPADYSANSGVLSWQDGETAPRIFSVTIINDSTIESAETFSVQLTSPTGGAALGSPAIATVTIIDDDSVGSLAFNPANGHYYEYVPTQVTWAQARADAESRVFTNGWRGHLVTMQDAAENAFVTALVSKPNCWIGGFQPAGSVEPGGGWRWVTGEPFSYLNWLGGEPNESGGGNEDSIIMDGASYLNPGKWSDLNGATALTGYVVEYEPQTLDNGLVARYAFDGNANDLGIFANHGTLNGGSFVTGIAGNALVFTGTSFVSVPSSASLKIAGTNITLAAWVFPTNYWAGGKSIVVRKMQHGGPTGGYLMGITEAGRLTFGGVFSGIGEWQDTADAGTVPLYSWTHVAVTYDGGLVRYYLNGVLVDTTPRTGSLLTDEQPLAIGKITTSFFGELFYGVMDEVRIYHRTLGPSDVAALHGSAPRWQLLPPFAPNTQDSVLWSGNGSVGQEDETQNVEAFSGFIYYVTHTDGAGSPSKVRRFDPATGSNIVILAESANQFWSLKAMRGALFISHLNGRLWRHDGISSTEVTGNPFAPTNHVTSMAEFGGKMYFGTSSGRIYESADGAAFVERTSIGGRIYALAEWKGNLYGANSEFYSYSAKIFRTSDGLNWTILSTNSVYSFHGFVAAPNHLYLISVDNANGPSLAIRATADGTTWTRIFYTTTEGKNMLGRSVFFQQTGRAYFGSEWAGVTRLIPVYEGQVESRFVMAHALGSLVEVDGRLFGLGGQSPANRGASPYVISLLGNYTTSQASPPAIADHPKGLTVPAGASASFAVSAIGSEPFTYQWRKDTVAILAATNATLTLAGVESSQAGSYSVVVSNPSGSATSSNAILAIVTSPNAQPNNPFPPPPHVLIGSMVTLTSQATGLGLSYQWMFNGANIVGAVGQTFTISNATTAHAGRYTVRVSNLAGNIVEDVATLNFMGNLQMYSGILVTGSAGEQYQVRYANVLGGMTNWLVLTNFVHPGGEHLFIDRTSPGRDKRFYQVERYFPQ